MQLRIQIQPSGSFSVYNGQTILLEDCYPTLNKRPLRALHTSVSGNEITYTTESGDIKLVITEKNASSVDIAASFHNFTRPIFWFSVLGEAMTKNMSGFFRSAHNTCAQSEYNVTSDLGSRSALSVGLVSLDFDKTYLTMHVDRHDRFTHLYVFTPGDNGVTVSSEFQVENVGHPDEVFPVLHLNLGTDMLSALESAAQSIGQAMHARNHQPPAYHWCSWYYFYHNFDQPQLEDCLAHFPKLDVPIRYIQIDAGYCPSLGDWLIPNERWPKGLKGAFDDIRAAGYEPGIWVGPFMVGNRSKLFAEHPDWMIHGLDGKLVPKMISDNEPKIWGLQDEVYYGLDTSHPDAMDYLRNVFRTLKEWGASMFKTDFMLWGLDDSLGPVKRHTPGKTSVEYFRDVLQMIREEIGEDSYWLGCIAPFMPFIGYCDAMRIGGDVGSCWSGGFGPHGMINAVKGNAFSNHAYYQNDPDAMIVRDFHVRLTEREIYSLTLLAALSGGCVYTSDELHKIAPDRLDLFRFVQPDIRRQPRMPYLATKKHEIIMIHENETRSQVIVFLFNPMDTDILAQYSLKEFGLPEGLHYRDFFAPEQPIDWTDSVYLNTPAHGCRMLIGSRDPERLPDKKSLWANLHD